MTETELKRKTYLDKAIDRRIIQKATAKSLGNSQRQVRKLIRRYRQEGNEALESLQCGRLSNRKLKKEVVEQIRQFIHQSIMDNFKPTLIQGKLEKATRILVSKEPHLRLMINENLHVAKAKKPKEIHPPRELRQRWGELVQIGGSYHA